MRGCVPSSGRICTLLYAFARCSALQCGTVCCSELLCVFVCLCGWLGLFCDLVGASFAATAHCNTLQRWIGWLGVCLCMCLCTDLCGWNCTCIHASTCVCVCVCVSPCVCVHANMLPYVRPDMATSWRPLRQVVSDRAQIHWPVVLPYMAATFTTVPLGISILALTVSTQVSSGSPFSFCMFHHKCIAE